MTDKEIIDFLENLKIYKTKYEIYLKNHFPHILNMIYVRTKFLSESYTRKITFSERIFCIKNNIVSPCICPTCNKNLLNFRVDICQYRQHCSTKCAKSSIETINKRKQTNLKKYGMENYRNDEKIKKTRHEKYDGNWHPKDQVEKSRKTKLERYGTIQYNNLEKYKNTCIEKYGVDHPLKDPNVKKSYIQNFANTHNGISCAFQLPDVIEKTKNGIRNRSWSIASNLINLELLTSRNDFFNIESLEKSESLTFKCITCGTIFNSNWDNGHCKQCPVCFPALHGTSHLEQELFEYINTFVDAQNSYKKLISPYELDVYIESCKLAFEFDGLYWHRCESKNDAKYHLMKTELCEKQGIQLIHIFENEWLSKQHIVKSRIKNLLGKYDRTVFARKCEIKEVDSTTSLDFQEENHIQGAVRSKVNLGLFYDDNLISLMTFSKCRFDKKHEWELVRFCNRLGYHVPGAASRLLKYFERTYLPKSLVSYADRRWSQGKLYKTLGFDFCHASAPNYWYFKPSNTAHLYSRLNFQKHKLKEKLQVFNEDMTEVENMLINGYHRIFDCGNLVFEKTY